MATVRLRDLTAAMDSLYDPANAAEWDQVGLVCGDPDAVVERVLLAVDPAAPVVDEALDWGAGLLITHHPLFLHARPSAAATTWRGRLVHRLVSGGCALLVAHTNADVARPGVSDALAEVLGVDPESTQPLRPGPGAALDLLTVYVPRDERDRLVSALAAAGAGRLGDYERAAFFADGTGTFRPLPGARPAIGSVGAVEEVPEALVQMIVPADRHEDVVRALRATHPYEEPAFTVVAALPEPGTTGLGRVGELREATTVAGLARRAAQALGVGPEGVRAAGAPERTVRRVAVVGGAGDSELDLVRSSGVDAYVTADLRHHPALDAMSAEGPALLDVGHWASEHPWLGQAARLLGDALGPAASVETRVSTVRTSPWTVLEGSQP
ncbi:MAG TPA: Nif3-like dinuclear metal center hexameric protein [Actinomycetes bacterium]|nr:Nif3-like dinuclear metal center hexameric protein [Actinomycetes bacterium]